MEVKENQNRLLIKTELTNLNEKFLHFGYELYELKFAITGQPPKPPLLSRNLKYILISLFIVIFSICYQCEVFGSLLKQALGVRCIIPNNVFVWEATRPISDCQYCINVTEPILLYNLTREEFSKYAFTSKPVIIKKSFLHWPAVTVFSFKFFKNLYDNIDNAYRSVDEDCQFLHFRSNFISLRDVFAMSEARSNNSPGETSWYVGWGNCDPDVLKEMHKYYPKPHFLPADSEHSGTEFVFMGYDSGATLHLDFISRLMWQAQLQGSKTWYLRPSPECETMCHSLSFLAEAGDAVLIDTRQWYHGTVITPGEFSLAIQSEYG